MYAADKGHTAAAQMLLWGDANCKFRNNNGDSALSLASSRGHQEVIKLLNDYGANSIFSFSSWFG
jgi:ankyrin repeat protein